MIVVQRALSERESAALAGQPVVDLTTIGDGSRANRVQANLLEWIDRADGFPIDGLLPSEFFRLGTDSYWPHIRSRLFYALLGDAQLLDALPDPSTVGQTTRVYCAADARAFWERWAPTAEVILPSEQPQKAHRQAPRNAIRRLLRSPAEVIAVPRRLSDRGREGLFFSSSTYGIVRDGKLWDRQFGPLFDRYDEKNWLRIEFRPLPRTGGAPRPDLPSGLAHAHPTVDTDLLLLHHLLRQPTLIPAFLLDLYRIQRRLRGPIHYEYPFPGPTAVWQSLLRRAIRQTGPSIAVLHLLRKVFSHSLARTSPRFVAVTAEAHSVGRLVVEEARRRTLPVVGVQHGAIQPHNVDYRMTPGLGDATLPDKLLVWSEGTRDFLVSQSNYPAESIDVVGRLLSDTLGRSSPDPAVEAHGQRTGKQLVFFASQPQPNAASREATARLLAAFCAKMGLACVVKLHPGEVDDGLYRGTFDRQGVLPGLLVREGDLFSMIAACAFGGTCYSTVAWEIMLLGKPLILFDPLGLDLLGLRDSPSVFTATLDPDSFAAWRERSGHWITENKTLAERALGWADGQVAERIMRSIDALVEQRGR